MESSDLVHHAMNNEISALLRCFLLEDVYKHDIHHGLHKYVCTIRTNVVNLLYPSGIVVVLFDPKLEGKGIA